MFCFVARKGTCKDMFPQFWINQGYGGTCLSVAFSASSSDLEWIGVHCLRSSALMLYLFWIVGLTSNQNPGCIWGALQLMIIL